MIEKYSTIEAACSDKILRLSLNRPELRNAIDDTVNSELCQAFAQATYDDDIHVIVLTGNGRAFSAGGDIPNMQRKIDDPNLFYKSIFSARRLVTAILDCPKPVICRLNGDAVGLGATVALLCDIVIANDEARIADPHINVGLVAGDGGALIWPYLIGLARAKRFLLGGEFISGKEAAEIGLVAYSVPTGELDAVTDKWARKLSRSALKAIMGTKVTLNAPLRQATEPSMSIGMAFEALSNLTEDHQEAVTAFMEKRKPEFKGR